MAKYYVSTTHHPILFHAKRCGFLKNDLCRRIPVGEKTLANWIENPGLIPLDKIIVMAGLFGIPVEELVYILIRNKPQLNEEGKWYLEGMRRNK